MSPPGLVLLLAAALAASGLATPAEPTSPPTSPPTSTSTQSSSPSPSTELNLCPCAGGGRNSSAADSYGRPRPGAELATTPDALIHGMTCLCHAGPARGSPARDDYRYSPGVGAHKLHTRAATWNEARKMCNEEGGHLAIVNSITEAHVLMDIFGKSGPVKGASYLDLAFVGIHDMYQEGEWVSLLGDSLFRTGYTSWSDKWGGQPDNGGGNQNCGVFLKEGGLDDVNCNVPFAFFCELPMTYVLR